MAHKIVKNIIRIDEEKCDGCGECVLACAEGAIEVVDGKARLISESYCDGLGFCIGECPQGAITLEERDNTKLIEEASELNTEKGNDNTGELPYGCSSSTITQLKKTGVNAEEVAGQRSMLSNWPVQLALVPPEAPFLQEADLLLVADCVPFVYARFHQDFLTKNALLVACPKLDDFQAHLKHLAEILSHSSIKSLTVLHMEVPCCLGLVNMVRQAMELAGKDILIKEITIDTDGRRRPID
ncbi:ATP-binding protein [Chloroflexota bacterium]